MKVGRKVFQKFYNGWEVTFEWKLVHTCLTVKRLTVKRKAREEGLTVAYDVSLYGLSGGLLQFMEHVRNF